MRLSAHIVLETAFAMCGCGQLMCYDGFSEEVSCPWCRRQVSFGYGGSDGFDVQRGRGWGIRLKAKKEFFIYASAINTKLKQALADTLAQLLNHKTSH